MCRVAGGASPWVPIADAADAARRGAPRLFKRCDAMSAALEKATRKTDGVSAAVDDAATKARKSIRDAMDGLRLAVAEREAELLRRVDAYVRRRPSFVSADVRGAGRRAVLSTRRPTPAPIRRYVGALGLALDARRATLVADAGDVAVAREAASDASAILENHDAQFLSVTAAVAKRLGELQARLTQEPLAPPPVDAKALRFELDDATAARILALTASTGAVLRPDDPITEPGGDDPERWFADLCEGGPGKTPANRQQAPLQIPGLIAAPANLEKRRR